jgi:hypothetical protein
MSMLGSAEAAIPIFNFPVANWVMIPAPWRLDAPTPTAVEQKWVMFLSGVAIVDFRGTRTSDWDRETLKLKLDTRPAIESTGAQARPNRELGFQVEQWAPFATINSIVDKNQAINAGFAVDSFSPILTSEGVEEISQIFYGLDVQAAIRDNDAILHRIGYQVTMLGRIVQFTPRPID